MPSSTLTLDVAAVAPSTPDLGEFAITGTVLGTGGYGKVVTGTNRSTAEQVAIKEIDLTRIGMRKHEIAQEVELLRRLAQHPNIIGLLGYFVDGPRHYIVMEAFLGGELIKQVKEHGALPEEAVRHYGTQIVAGVVHLHKCGVAHRDLKLENVLLDLTLTRVKIIDFGLAHLHRPRADGDGYEPEELRDTPGSKSYRPPEMLASVPLYNGFAADVYSLGVCLFGLAAGFFPLEEACPKDWRFVRLARAQLVGKSTVHTIFTWYKKPCPFSPALAELLDGMLQIDLRQRWPLERVRDSDFHRVHRGVAAAAPDSLKPR